MHSFVIVVLVAPRGLCLVCLLVVEICCYYSEHCATTYCVSERFWFVKFLFTSHQYLLPLSEKWNSFHGSLLTRRCCLKDYICALMPVIEVCRVRIHPAELITLSTGHTVIMATSTTLKFELRTLRNFPTNTTVLPVAISVRSSEVDCTTCSWDAGRYS